MTRTFPQTDQTVAGFYKTRKLPLIYPVLVEMRVISSDQLFLGWVLETSVLVIQAGFTNSFLLFDFLKSKVWVGP